MAEHIASTGRTLLTYILNFQWTHKIHALLRHRLITVTFMTQRLHRLRSHALPLRSLSLSRLRSPRTPVIALGLKSTNHSPQIPGGSRDLLPDSQLLPDSLLNESIPSPPLFVPDSQADSSQELSQGTNHRYYTCAPQTSRDLRLQIQIALLFRIPHAEIK